MSTCCHPGATADGCAWCVRSAVAVLTREHVAGLRYYSQAVTGRDAHDFPGHITRDLQDAGWLRYDSGASALILTSAGRRELDCLPRSCR